MPDFYLITTELDSQHVYAPRACRVLRWLRDKGRDDLALVSVDPSIPKSVRSASAPRCRSSSPVVKRTVHASFFAKSPPCRDEAIRIIATSPNPSSRSSASTSITSSLCVTRPTKPARSFPVIRSGSTGRFRIQVRPMARRMSAFARSWRSELSSRFSCELGCNCR